MTERTYNEDQTLAQAHCKMTQRLFLRSLVYTFTFTLHIAQCVSALARLGQRICVSSGAVCNPTKQSRRNTVLYQDKLNNAKISFLS